MNKQNKIITWLIWLDTIISIFSLIIGLLFSSSWLNLLCIIPIAVNLYCLKLVKEYRLNFAINMVVVSIVFSVYLVDSGFNLNLGTYLFYVPILIGIYLFDTLGSKNIKWLGMLSMMLSMILVNIGWAPNLLFKEIALNFGSNIVLLYSIFISFLASAIALNLFSKLQKKSELELEINQANILALLENSNDPIWSIDTEYKLVSFNSSFARLYEGVWKNIPKAGNSILFSLDENSIYKDWNSWFKRALNGESFQLDVAYKAALELKTFEMTFKPIMKGNERHGAIIKAIDITSRKKALEDQQLISQNLELLLSSTQEIIFEMDENDCCTKVWKGENQVMLNSEDYFLGKTIAQLFDEPFETDIMSSFLKTKETGEPTEYEYAYKLKGTVKHYLAKLRRIKNSNPPKVSIVIEDITSRKEIENKQIEQSIFLNKLIAHLPIGVFVKDVQSNLTYTLWNKELENMFGFKEEDVIGKTDEEIFKNSEEITNYLATDNWVITEKEPILIQKLAIKVEDRQIYARTFKVPILDADGEVSSILGILENITDVLIAQDELLKAEKRWNYALSGSRDAVWDVNLITDETFFSPVMNEMLGYKAFETLIEKWEDLVHPEDLPRAWNIFVDHLEGKSQYYECEYRLRKKDNSYFWVLDRGKVAETDNDGNPIRVIGTYSNIDYRKSLEEEYKIALQKAEAASKAKSLFLSTMSHEIRTPMNGVIGITNLLLNSQPKAEQKDNLNALKYAADNLLYLLNDILDFNKIDAGKLDLEEKSFSLYECLENTLKSFTNSAKAKGLNIKLEASNNFPKAILGDKMRLNQVINNLISNAVKFTEKGEVGLYVKLEEVSADWIRTSFRVWDTGIGIEEEFLPKLFEQFSQASSDTTRKYGGSGLGLAICQRLVTILGGDLKVSSEVNKGTEFWFNLDLKIDLNYVEPSAKDTGKLVEAFPGMQLLLVEDNAMNIFVAKQFLTRWEIEVDVALTGKDALLCVQRKQYDLILMDLQMPVMDGFESASLMRKGGIKTPIFALSANVNLEAKELAIAKGMDDYITKPFNPEELMQKIAAIYKPRKKLKDHPSNTLF
ncbi:MAG: PAS domain S-box protein [bacterium]|nr:PAS domain S-box protein [bacterium]